MAEADRTLSFQNLIGNGTVAFMAPSIYEDPIFGIVRGIDSAGIWIESEDLTEMMHRAVKSRFLEGTPLFFLPFSVILWAVAFLDEPSISESLLDEVPPRTED